MANALELRIESVWSNSLRFPTFIQGSCWQQWSAAQPSFADQTVFWRKVEASLLTGDRAYHSVIYEDDDFRDDRTEQEGTGGRKNMQSSETGCDCKKKKKNTFEVYSSLFQ